MGKINSNECRIIIGCFKRLLPADKLKGILWKMVRAAPLSPTEAVKRTGLAGACLRCESGDVAQ